MVLYIENPKDTISKLLELISEVSKVSRYNININIEKSLTFLHINNEKSEREIKESITFTIAAKRFKYLGINLPKETKWKQCQTLFFGAPKSLLMVTAAKKLKDAYSLEGKL